MCNFCVCPCYRYLLFLVCRRLSSRNKYMFINRKPGVCKLSGYEKHIRKKAGRKCPFLKFHMLWWLRGRRPYSLWWSEVGERLSCLSRLCRMETRMSEVDSTNLSAQGALAPTGQLLTCYWPYDRHILCQAQPLAVFSLALSAIS